MTTTPSARAREAAAEYIALMQYPGSPYAGQKAHIGMHVVQAFARFEAEIRVEATRAANERIAELEGAFDLYGRHFSTCEVTAGASAECNCGLEETRAALQHKEPKP
ncbi:hypothetical protein ACGGKE_07775 [Sphingobium naphthae]|uniref:hypothetical protein n=1 Tax=Sphingobium naphthae TaxID=1886786 RepID=UPI003747EBD1